MNSWRDGSCRPFGTNGAVGIPVPWTDAHDYNTATAWLEWVVSSWLLDCSFLVCNGKFKSQRLHVLADGVRPNWSWSYVIWVY